MRLSPKAVILLIPAQHLGLNDVVIDSNETARLALRSRRHQLGLTLPSFDAISSLTVYHFAKAEKDNPSRAMGMDLPAVWAASFGYEIVLWPKVLPPLALKILEEKGRS